jgi:3',5'-cyclic-AMP phosphodiesterase
MKRIAWLTDIHWDRLSADDRREQTGWIADAEPDAVILSGDIGEADSFGGFLAELHERLNLPVYFILGNHDFWRGSFDGARKEARRLSERFENLHYISDSDVVPLNENVCLIGDDGWADGRAGDPREARDFPRDFLRIADFAKLSRDEYFARLNLLGDEVSARTRTKLLRALAHNSYRHIYLTTHVPPFGEACLDSYRICHKHKLPFYCCQALGEMLVEVMKDYPDRKLTVLCGHTHNECDLKVRDNLRVLVKEAAYTSCYPPTMIDLSD